MCGAILRTFNSKSCRWEGGNDMCVLDPVYSRKDYRLQLIPGTARFNLPSYRNSNSFQTWPCRYNYVHLIQCNHAHNLKHLLAIALASQYYKSARYNELASRYFELVLVVTSWFLVITSWLLNITIWLLVLSSWFLVITSWFLVITSWFLVITSWFLVITSWFLVNTN